MTRGYRARVGSAGCHVGSVPGAASSWPRRPVAESLADVWLPPPRMTAVSWQMPPHALEPREEGEPGLGLGCASLWEPTGPLVGALRVTAAGPCDTGHRASLGPGGPWELQGRQKSL